MAEDSKRREFLRSGAAAGLLTGGLLATAGFAAATQQAVAQSAPGSRLRTVLDRGHVIVGTGSTNAPWHFENEQGELVGMDVTMGHILARALFDDDDAVEFVMQDPAQRIPNITTGRVDAVIQFMTISGQRSQLVNFTRPYYVEGAALLTLPGGDNHTFEELEALGSNARVSILQNVGADDLVRQALPEAQVMQIDTQANVIQALEARRVDAAAVDLSTVRWLVARNPDRYFDAGKQWYSMLYGAAVGQGDLDWLHFVSTVFTIAMFGHETELYDAAFSEFFGLEPPARVPGFPTI